MSPNCGPRCGGAVPDLVVLHYTAMTDAEVALDRLCDPQAEVSAHYLISRQGNVIQMVDESMRAWHAGAGGWGNVHDINSRSIGIELDNTGAQPYSEPQMLALEALLMGILNRWEIPPERVIAHSDMAPIRKIDPGVKFDWCRLAHMGLSVWPETATLEKAADGRADERVFRAAALAFGYPELETEMLLSAFRLRFRPHAKGALTVADVAVLTNLAARFPVDRGGRSA